MKLKADKKAFRLGVRQHHAVLDFVTDLQEAMERLAMSQQDLAGRLGKSRSWISKVFRRKPNLTFFTAVELADGVGLELRVGLAEPVSETKGTFVLNAAGIREAPVSVGSSIPLSGVGQVSVPPAGKVRLVAIDGGLCTDRAA